MTQRVTDEQIEAIRNCTAPSDKVSRDLCRDLLDTRAALAEREAECAGLKAEVERLRGALEDRRKPIDSMVKCEACAAAWVDACPRCASAVRNEWREGCQPSKGQTEHAWHHAAPAPPEPKEDGDAAL